MRIVIAAETYYPNADGASYFSQRLAYYLKKRGNEVLVIAPALVLRNGFFSHQGIKVYGLKSVRIVTWKNFRRPTPFIRKSIIRKIFKDFQPEIVHIQSHFAVGKVVNACAKQLDIPVVGTNHFMPENVVHYLHLPNVLDRFVKNQAWKYFYATYNELDHVTTPTFTAANVLKQAGFEKPVTVISNGVDINKFNPDNEGDYLRKRYDIPDKPVLLFVGRVDKEKNVDLVIRALNLIEDKSKIHLVVAGIGAEQKKLANLVKELSLEKYVTFTGFVPDEDLPNLYSIAKGFVMLGMAELQGIAVMEAMATGLPVIATNAVALPELVKHRENGFLCEHGDIKGLAKYIETIFSNDELCERMGRKSRELIKDHRIELVMDRFESIYRQVLNSK